MASVAVVVVAADRGHFNWSLPLAEALVTDDVVQKVESLGQRRRFWDAVPINGIQIYIYIFIWVHYNDLTACDLTGNHDL